jgi:hypothetical protein
VKGKREQRDPWLVELEELLLLNSKEEEVVLRKDSSNKGPVYNGLKLAHSSREKTHLRQINQKTICLFSFFY